MRDVVRLRDCKRTAGTRRVHQLGHARARAGIGGTTRRADLQEKRGRACPAVPAITAWEPPWESCVQGHSRLLQDGRRPPKPIRIILPREVRRRRRSCCTERCRRRFPGSQVRVLPRLSQLSPAHKALPDRARHRFPVSLPRGVNAGVNRSGRAIGLSADVPRARIERGAVRTGTETSSPTPSRSGCRTRGSKA